MPEYGLTAENQKLICEKAKSKNDGCYRFRGVAYRVKDGKATHFAAQGNILLNRGVFNVLVGVYKPGIGGDEKAQKLLKMITS